MNSMVRGVFVQRKGKHVKMIDVLEKADYRETCKKTRYTNLFVEIVL